MYENMTYENILQGMLGRVSDTFDKREGSVIYDALAPSAYYMAEQYALMEEFINLVFPDTAAGEYLDRAAALYNITRKSATAAVRIAISDRELAVGSRWHLNDLSYRITGASDTPNQYYAECETVGTIGNLQTGKATAAEYGNPANVTIGAVEKAGTDCEMDEAYRARLYTAVRMPSTSGNIYDYYNWAMECGGIGAARVIPCGNGAGTVKIVVAGSNMGVVDSETLEETLAHIEELRPVGADVSVVSAEVLNIDISADVKVVAGYVLDDINREFTTALNNYFKDNIFEMSYISISRVGNILINTKGIEDYTNLKLNGKTENVEVSADNIVYVGSADLRMEE